MKERLISKYAEQVGGTPESPQEAYTHAIADFQELLHDDYHEISIISVSLAIQALREKRMISTPLALEQVKSMVPSNTNLDFSAEREWLWIEILNNEDQNPRKGKVSAYYRIEPDYTQGRSLCCGYPAIGYAFDYSDYGKTWLAFLKKPHEKREKSHDRKGKNTDSTL